MTREERDWGSHVLVLPYPAQGHINPMLQFSKLLSSNGIKVTLAITPSIAKSMQAKSGTIGIEQFSDGYDEGGIRQAGSIQVYFESLKVVGSMSLSKLIEKQNGSKFPIKCLIYDSFMPWGLDLAKRFGLIGATFFTQTCAVNAIYYHVYQGLSITPVQRPTILMPGLPPLEAHELPSFVSDKVLFPQMLRYFLNQFSNIDKADWIFFNTFDKLENEVLTWMRKQWPMRTMTIGPTVPSIYLDDRVEFDKNYGLNLFKPDLDTCMEWLNTKETRSVVYVSFGSVFPLGAEQIEELTWGLRRSNYNFLLVTKSLEEKSFAGETLEKGLFVTWCPQLEVLAHQAIGCFITHCGLNSTLEALSLGVPMVAMPQCSDQTTNAKFVEDVWRVGIRAKADEKGIVQRDEIVHCLREILKGEKGREIMKNSEMWKDLAKEAVNEGGSSYKNIEEFVARLVCNSY